MSVAMARPVVMNKPVFAFRAFRALNIVLMSPTPLFASSIVLVIDILLSENGFAWSARIGVAGVTRDRADAAGHDQNGSGPD
jgi:hypothetical protein